MTEKKENRTEKEMRARSRNGTTHLFDAITSAHIVSVFFCVSFVIILTIV
jgi:hypothetical protein